MSTKTKTPTVADAEKAVKTAEADLARWEKALAEANVGLLTARNTKPKSPADAQKLAADRSAAENLVGIVGGAVAEAEVAVVAAKAGVLHALAAVEDERAAAANEQRESAQRKIDALEADLKAARAAYREANDEFVLAEARGKVHRFAAENKTLPDGNTVYAAGLGEQFIHLQVRGADVVPTEAREFAESFMAPVTDPEPLVTGSRVRGADERTVTALNGGGYSESLDPNTAHLDRD